MGLPSADWPAPSIWEGLRRLRGLVPADALYGSVGFTEAQVGHVWARVLPA